MSLLLWVMGFVAAFPMTQAGQYPCKAVHYARPGMGTTMQSVMLRRICPGADCIKGFHPRADVSDYIAVRYADEWRIAQDWRALVTFRSPSTGQWSYPVWLQPVDYQAPWDVRNNNCRVETSARLADRQGWSLYEGWGTTTARIIEWQR